MWDDRSDFKQSRPPKESQRERQVAVSRFSQSTFEDVKELGARFRTRGKGQGRKANAERADVEAESEPGSADEQIWHK
jgi:hypothetical protein